MNQSQYSVGSNGATDQSRCVYRGCATDPVCIANTHSEACLIRDALNEHATPTAIPEDDQKQVADSLLAALGESATLRIQCAKLQADLEFATDSYHQEKEERRVISREADQLQLAVASLTLENTKLRDAASLALEKLKTTGEYPGIAAQLRAALQQQKARVPNE